MTELVQDAFHGQAGTATPLPRWLPVVGYEGLYEVSDHGAVRSLERIDCRGRHIRPRVLRQTRMRDGHMRVYLSADRSQAGHLVHRLVLTAFVGPCPDGMEGCHNDGNPANNWLSNLRWDTRSNNRHDAVRHGVDPNATKTHCPHGHPYSAENTYTWKRRRQCRTCKSGRPAVGAS